MIYLFLLTTIVVALICEVRVIAVGYIKGLSFKDVDDTAKLMTEMVIEHQIKERLFYRSMVRYVLLIQAAIFIIDKIVVYLK